MQIDDDTNMMGVPRYQITPQEDLISTHRDRHRAEICGVIRTKGLHAKHREEVNY